ncbi:Kinesin-like protein KIN-1 [Sesamum alatum]|uniref:Kinesin-like protein KIN-1 n=1 Tax=Sesamum alatum TaxID=300844 RepID=A0AAE1XMC4_9LAMI|nr:Kinesin-like protein KIN-1 [Sesamum alatum]
MTNRRVYLPRVVDGLFNAIKLFQMIMTRYTIKLSMVEIYLERVRFASLDKAPAIALSAILKLDIDYVWEIRVYFRSEKAERLELKAEYLRKPKLSINHCQHLEILIVWINLSSSFTGRKSRRHCFVAVHLALKMHQKSLSTLRFGARAKHIKALPHVSLKEDEDTSGLGALTLMKNESCERILEKLSQKMKAEDVQLLAQLFILEGIFFDPNSVEEVEAAYDDVTSRTISTLQKAVEELSETVEQLKKENQVLKGLTRSC